MVTSNFDGLTDSEYLRKCKCKCKVCSNASVTFSTCAPRNWGVVITIRNGAGVQFRMIIIDFIAMVQSQNRRGLGYNSLRKLGLASIGTVINRHFFGFFQNIFLFVVCWAEGCVWLVLVLQPRLRPESIARSIHKQRKCKNNWCGRCRWGKGGGCQISHKVRRASFSGLDLEHSSITKTPQTP
jgi:hypothetical protein